MHARTPRAGHFVRMREAVKSLVSRLMIAAALVVAIVVARPLIHNPDPRIMLTSVVMVKLDDGNGSGVVVWAGNGYSLILTNYHVIENQKTIRVVGQRYGEGGTLVDETNTKATVVRSSKGDDLALLRVEYELPTVTLALKAPPPFTPVYAVGAQRGLHPVPTPGIVMSVNRGLVISAPIAPGSSGGASFALIDGEYRLIGIPHGVQALTLKVETARGPVRTIRGEPITVDQFLSHLVYVIPIKRVRLFLGGMKEFGGSADSGRPMSGQ